MSRFKVALSVVVWLVLWQGAAILIHNTWVFAGPIDSLIAWVGLLQTAKFWLSILHSLGNIALGFVCAFICGLILGYFAGKSSSLRIFLKPAVTVIKSAPVVCVIALLLVIVGSNATTSIVVGLVVFPQFYHAIVEAALARNEDLDALLDVFGTTYMRRALCVEFVDFGASIRAAMAVSVGLAWKSGVAAELIGLPGMSIGEGVYLSKISLESASIIAWTATVILLSWICEKCLLALCEVAANAPKRWLSLRVGAASKAPGVAVEEPALNPCAISINGVKRTYQSANSTQTISFPNDIIDAGARVCIMAPSGSGKTTLLRIIEGLDSPDEGSVTFSSVDATNDLNPRISVMLQDTTLVKWASALENIALVANSDAEIQRGAAYLRQVLDEESLTKPVDSLSGGMRRRVELCRALAHTSSVVILDEPFSGLDEETKLQCIKLIDETLAGRTLIVATHDENDAKLLNAYVKRIA